jgi:hypothetical protein
MSWWSGFLDALIVDPNFGELPEFNSFVFSTSEQSLFSFVPHHLRDCCSMRLQDVDWCLLFQTPDCHDTAFIRCQNLSSGLLSPLDKSHVLLSLKANEKLCLLLFTSRE